MSKIYFLNDPKIGLDNNPREELSNVLLTSPCAAAHSCGTNGCSLKNTNVDDILHFTHFTA